MQIWSECLPACTQDPRPTRRSLKGMYSALSGPCVPVKLFYSVESKKLRRGGASPWLKCPLPGPWARKVRIDFFSKCTDIHIVLKASRLLSSAQPHSQIWPKPSVSISDGYWWRLVLRYTQCSRNSHQVDGRWDQIFGGTLPAYGHPRPLIWIVSSRVNISYVSQYSWFCCERQP
jgi:hypothetical protein